MSGSNRPRTGRARSPLSASPSDEVLLQRVAGADREAFEELYGRLVSPVYGLVLCMVGDRAVAEDVTQEVFVQVWSRAACFDATWGAARPWVLTTAHREAVDAVRRAPGGRAGSTSSVDTARRSGHRVEDPAGAKHRALPDEPALQRPIAALSERQRDVLGMVHYGGLSYREVARALHLPLSVVPVHLRDGLRRLADHRPPAA